MVFGVMAKKINAKKIHFKYGMVGNGCVYIYVGIYSKYYCRREVQKNIFTPEKNRKTVRKCERTSGDFSPSLIVAHSPFGIIRLYVNLCKISVYVP